MSNSSENISFNQLGLSSSVLKAVKENGYEQPSPIQVQSIPAILSGRDVLGQAQTGTGKTAAFALPILTNLNLHSTDVQVLVLTPTRELAIQVSEAFQSYAKYIKGFHVLPIYGGQSFEPQLRALKRGVHVVVGTPGRVMDHMRRNTLKLDALKTLVLDEADEMLRMGFIDDVDWILGHTPKDRQIALYSATMPPQIKKVATNHLNKPVDIKIVTKTTTSKNINQRYWLVSGLHKLDALTRLLETENFDGVLVFVRTKVATEELADKLKARGFAAEALNGDLVQKQRERLVNNLKNGSIDILIGTDVVARGLDVDRISHVINYDIPYDIESYVHRIGRTGRAGRSGEAILFVGRREQRMLRMIESATKQPIQPMKMPTVADINSQRMQKFKDKISDTLATADLGIFQQLVREFQKETENDTMQIAAALAYMSQKELGSLLTKEEDFRHEMPESKHGKDSKNKKQNRPDKKIKTEVQPLKKYPEVPMQRYKIAVGYNENVKPSNIVGMIANEAEIDKDFIGHIEIYDSMSTVDLPDEMPDEILKQLQEAFICGKRSNMQVLSEEGTSSFEPHKKKPFQEKRKPVSKKGKSKKAISPNSKSKKTARKPTKKARKKF